MRIDIITIFPKMFEPVLNESIIKRAQNKGKVKIFVHNLRDYSPDKHRKVDDRPFGGGSGMVMRPEPIFNAVEAIKSQSSATMRGGPASAIRIGGCTNICGANLFGGHKVTPRLRSGQAKSQVILLCPQGKRLDQKIATGLAKHKHLLLICGHYEGVDERVRQYLVDEEISIGDYVLTGGELPAMVLIDALIRLIPGVLGDKNSLNFESFKGNLLDPSLIGMGKVYPLGLAPSLKGLGRAIPVGLEYPHYTRPAKFRNMRVPPILLSGDHKKIEIWRRKEALERTKLRRPDLLKS